MIARHGPSMDSLSLSQLDDTDRSRTPNDRIQAHKHLPRGTPIACCSGSCRHHGLLRGQRSGSGADSSPDSDHRCRRSHRGAHRCTNRRADLATRRRACRRLPERPAPDRPDDVPRRQHPGARHDAAPRANADRGRHALARWDKDGRPRRGAERLWMDVALGPGPEQRLGVDAVRVPRTSRRQFRG